MMPSDKHQDKQISLEKEIAAHKDKLRETVQGKKNAGRWFSLIRKHTNLTMLTAPILNELIEEIVVHKATKDKDGKGIQKVKIYYGCLLNFVVFGQLIRLLEFLYVRLRFRYPFF